ncbi:MULTISPECIES: thermostable hemolysin [unclassified Neptuniibacter]|uniref:thermostable hemolysin n=1 Tax=unclassified Neptuniibacter TaxID=2630693 RepID=UPI000C4B9949|nr:MULTISPECIES: thermostable hemolysin [unclassified Neptuniibacter]MAY42362.1 hypothetical protein [Oceanospirillaceae bacterium]|tara:strand:+ start:11699 stop:12391 length:693 start_codon:yes stop_codon:yes gene_type:complete
MSVATLTRNELSTPESDVLLVTNPQNKERVRQFAEARFKAAYGAEVNDFLPNVLALLDSQHAIKASAGYQSADASRLYLEHYLNQSVEESIAHSLNIKAPQRSEILEVGNLASSSPGSTRRLILNLACHFEKLGYRWLAITATPHVRNSFEKLNIGFNLYPIAKAEAEAVKHTDSSWGNYYDHNPEVYVGDIRLGINTLRSNPILSKLLQRQGLPLSDQGISIQTLESKK